jgi:hypothetical protein
MKSFVGSCLFLIFITGCATRPNITISVPFDEIATKEQLRDGTNTIKGSALIRQMGGGVVTCAGFPVSLFPSTAYSRTRITAIYGTAEGGLVPIYQPTPVFQPDPPVYRTLMKQTRCDSQGFFKFDNVADGDYYLTTGIVWKIGYVDQGGGLTTPVTVKNGEVKEVVLAR